ncbi:Elongator subunit elp6 [Mactra antiquata]
MFTELKNLVSNPNHCMSSKYFIGITEKKVDGSFLIHHFLSYFLKENCRVIFLSFRQALNHFNSVGNKIGNSLSIAKEQGNFCFIEGLKSLAQSVNNGVLCGENPWDQTINNNLVSADKLYMMLQSKIKDVSFKSDKNVVFIIDDISTLLDTGTTVVDTLAVVQYLQHLIIQELGGTLIIGTNDDMGELDDDKNILKNYLHHSVDLCLEVSGLETGYCKDVHGQLTVSWNNTVSREKINQRVAQYKLTDKNCAIFASGMSSAVL